MAIAPGLDGFLMAQQLGQQKQAQEFGVLSKLAQLQMQQAAAERQARLDPLQMDLLKAQIANQQAQGPLRALEAQERLQQIQGRGALMSELAKLPEAEGLRRVMEADARGETATVGVQNPDKIRSLTALAFPKEYGQAQAKALFPSQAAAGAPVKVPDANSPTGFRYVSRDQAAGMAAPGERVPTPPAPYFTPIQTATGVQAFNNRSGQAEPVRLLGQPIIGSQSDPVLQGRIAAAKAEGTEVGRQRSTIEGKQVALDSVGEAKSLLDKGIYTGAWAPVVKGAVKWTPGVNTDKAARTEEFLSHIGNIVIPRLKEFGGNDSNEEMRYLTRVMGGDIALEEKAIRGILNSAEFKIKRGIARLNSGQPVSPTTPAPASPAPSTAGGIRFLGFE